MRAISRRDVLKGGIGLLGALGILAASSGSLLQRLSGWITSPAFIHPFSIQVLERLDLDRFNQHLEDFFLIQLGFTHVAKLQLIEAVELRQSSTTLARAEEVFSLVFQGSVNHPITQDTYTLKHESIGAFPLFIVPISMEEDKIYYEAIIDRRHAV